MTGVIDVGGGMRGIYGAGVFDYCMDHGISFDTCIGVSAGGANVLSYAAGQRGRNYTYYMEYAFRADYMGMGNFLKNGSFINLDYIYGTLSNSDGEYPLDYPAIIRNRKKIRIVATDALTGRARYFGLKDFKQDMYDPVKASSCVPVVNKPYVIDGIPYYDGGISDPIPVNQAFRLGCDKVVAVLTRPVDSYRKSDTDRRMAALLRRRFPAAAYRLANRASVYNTELDLIKKYEKHGHVLIVAPQSIQGMKTLKKDRGAMEFMYQEGYHDAQAIAEFCRA